MEALRLVEDSQIWTKEVRILKDLIEQAKQQGKKIDDVAREIGVSRPYLSQFITGSYRSPKDSSLHLGFKVRAYLEQKGLLQEESALDVSKEERPEKETLWIRSVKEIGLVKTHNLRLVESIINWCREKCELDILVSRPGLGKSFALRECKRVYGDIVIIECDVDSTNKSILVDIAESIGAGASGSTSAIKKRIVKELRKSPRLLIFDEADLLSIKTIEMIRRLHDTLEDSIGMMLVGNLKLERMLLSCIIDDDDMVRLSDRFKRSWHLSAITETDTAFFLERVYATDAARRMLADIGMKRGIRQLVNALDRLLEATRGEKPITKELVEELGQVMLSMKI